MSQKNMSLTREPLLCTKTPNLVYTLLFYALEVYEKTNAVATKTYLFVTGTSESYISYTRRHNCGKKSNALDRLSEAWETI